MTKRDFRLLAVDVDGTLMCDGVVDAQDVQALRAAAAAGMLVCLCTGRSWAEVTDLWSSLELPAPHAPVVCVGGALVVEPDTGRTLYSRGFDRTTADELARRMRALGYPVMALVDAWREGFDYYVIGPHQDHGLYRRFFAARACRLRAAQSLDDPAAARVLRVSLLENQRRASEVVDALRGDFAGRVEIQAISLRRLRLHIVEAFAAGANKFSALVYVGQGHRIGPGAMAAIGDDYNDLPMLKGAAFSATTADAPEQLRQAATVVLDGRGPGTVAGFVHRLLGNRTGL